MKQPHRPIREANFTDGPIALPLIRFVFPIMFAMLVQSLYGAVDLLVVGQFSDAANVSAVSVGSQIMHSATVVIIQLAVGTTILLGQYIGQKRMEECGKVVGATIFTFCLIGIALAVVMQFFAPGAATLMNAPAEAFDQTVSYVRICGAGAVFIVAYNILGGIFRGIGDAKLPLIAVLIAAVFNVFGDLFFVAVLHMGAAGAAAATVMSQALSVILSLFVIRRRGMPFPFRVSDIAFHRPVILPGGFILLPGGVLLRCPELRRQKDASRREGAANRHRHFLRLLVAGGLLCLLPRHRSEQRLFQ